MNAPVPTLPAAQENLDDLPLLTEIVRIADALPDAVVEAAIIAPPPASEVDYQQLVARLENHFEQVLNAKLTPITTPPAIESLSEEAYQLLVDRLEDHLENLLTQKLTLYLERMKAQIVEQVTEDIRQDFVKRLSGISK